MIDVQVIQLVKKGLNVLLETPDNWLLKNDLSEQSISHRFALHLDALFEGYDVDCEYNGDVDQKNNKKAISILKSKLKQFGLLRNKEANDLEKEYANRAVFPDIIIHRRGTNSYNLCIIEVKKNTSSIDFNYDYIKLEAYTSKKYGNNLFYNLGIFVEMIIDKDNPTYELQFFKDGSKISEPTMR